MLAKASNQTFKIEKLLNPDVFPHEVTELRVLETHISWVILTGRHAYKIKKPVRFDFVDFSTLEARKLNCFKEVEFNRRFSPEIYQGVVPIVAVDNALRVGLETLQEGAEEAPEAIEFAVKMWEFSQDEIVAARLDHPELTSDAIARFGRYVADFHASIESANPTVDHVQVGGIYKHAMENFATLADGLGDDLRRTVIEALEQWTTAQFESLESTFAQRLKSGLVRRCHGDMHLKNIIQSDGRLIAFDGIEFNEELQWNDVLSEVAFPVMDLFARHRSDLGWRLLNSYLAAVGDYEGVPVLRFYLVYRAMVRAKVTWLNPQNHAQPTRERQMAIQEDPDQRAGPWDKYLKTARYFAFEMTPKLMIMHGFSGSGKSTLAAQLTEQEGAVCIRSDVQRQRLATESQREDKYSTEMNDWVFAHLLELTESCLSGGMPVIVDATFLKLKRRTPFRELAEKLNLEFEIISCDAPFEELCRRIVDRQTGPSEATIDVLKTQMETHNPLTTDELQFVRQASP